MSENRLPDYLDHIQQAATDARSFVEGMARDDFLADKCTQQAVIMSLIVIGEAATKVMDGYAEFTQAHAEVPHDHLGLVAQREHGAPHALAGQRGQQDLQERTARHGGHRLGQVRHHGPQPRAEAPRQDDRVHLRPGA